jgi:hypothetical protein
VHGARAARPLALALAFLLVLPATAAFVLVTSTTAFADAETVTRDFLSALKAADVERAKRLYDPRYASVQRVGLDGLFRYESGYQPNLAFLVGQPFTVESVALTIPIRSEWYTVDGVRGHNVTARLRFDADRGPFLLPSPVAFGRSMWFIDFMNFVKHPESGTFAELTLRLRPTVVAGTITPTQPPQMVKAPPPPVGPGGTQRPMTAMPPPTFEGGLMGARPRDAGAVILPSGEALTADQLAAMLPRLAVIDVMLTTMQRGRLASWKVEHVTFTNVVLSAHGAQIPLR